MTSETAGQPGREGRASAQAAPGWRLFGLLLGLALTVVGSGTVLFNSVQGVQATDLVGVRGTFRVDHCADTDTSRKNSAYECRGTFAARGEHGGAGRRGTLENAGAYPTGKTMDVVRGWPGDGTTFRETGAGPVMESVMWLCLGLGILAVGLVQTRKWARVDRNSPAQPPTRGAGPAPEERPHGPREGR